jgi:hypothetical protein
VPASRCNGLLGIRGFRFKRVSLEASVHPEAFFSPFRSWKMAFTRQNLAWIGDKKAARSFWAACLQRE